MDIEYSAESCSYSVIFNAGEESSFDYSDVVSKIFIFVHEVLDEENELVGFELFEFDRVKASCTNEIIKVDESLGGGI